MNSVAGIVLAAGGSSRLGSPKQLVSFQGESLVHRAARTVVEAGCDPVVVVLGAEAERIRPELDDLQIRSVINNGWPEGISTSIQTGLEEIGNAEAVLIVLCDQPGVNSLHLRDLMARFHAAGLSIAASRYRGVIGVPAVFAQSIYPELAALSGDTGARRVISRDAGRVVIFDLPQAGTDLDTPEDLLLLSTIDFTKNEVQTSDDGDHIGD